MRNAWYIGPPVVLGVTFVFLFSLVGPGLFLQPQRAMAAEPAYEQARDELAKTLRLVRQYREQLDTSAFDPAALARSIGDDTGALFAFVRDKIQLHPYRGVQRFAEGTLMSRAGSSCDKALLLGAMLRAHGHEVRYARGALDDAAARRRLAEVSPQPRLQHALMPLVPINPELEALTLRLGATPEEVAADRDATLVWQQAMIEGLSWGLQRNYDLLNRELVAAGVTIGSAANTDTARAVDNLREYCWVQVDQGGSWLDLDPSLRTSKPGDRPTEPASVTTTLPNELATQLEVTLRLERRQGDQSMSESVLKVTEVLNAAVNELQVALVPESAAAGVAAMNEQGNALDSLDVLWPVLFVNGRPNHGHPFNLQGAVVADEPAERLVKSQKEAMDLFGTRIEGEQSASASRLTGITVDFKLLQPDGRSSSWSRRLAGFNGNEIVFRADLLSPLSLVASASRVDPHWVETRLLDLLLTNRQLIAAGVDVGYNRLPPNWKELVEHAKPVAPPALLGLISMRGTLLDYLAAFYAPGLLAYPDGPLVAGWREHVIMGDEVRGEAEIDIMANAVTAIDFQRPDLGDRSASFREVQGISDTLLEYLLLGGGDAVNAHSVAYNAELNGMPFIVLKAGQTAADANMGADLAAGSVVVAPSHSVKLGDHEALAWWRIDPKTGSTLGIGSEGRGQSMTETVIVHAFVIGSICTGFAAWDTVQDPQTSGTGSFVKCIIVSVILIPVGYGLSRIASRLFRLVAARMGVKVGGAVSAAAAAAAGAGGSAGAKPSSSKPVPAKSTPVKAGGPKIEPAPPPEPAPPKKGSGSGQGGSPSAEPVEKPYDPMEPPGPPGPKPKPKPTKPFEPKKGGLFKGLDPGEGKAPGTKTEPANPVTGKKTQGVGFEPLDEDFLTREQKTTARKVGENINKWNRNPPLSEEEIRKQTEFEASRGLDAEAIEAGVAWKKGGVSIDEIMRTTGQSREWVMEALNRYLEKGQHVTDPATRARLVNDWANGNTYPQGDVPTPASEPKNKLDAYNPFEIAKPDATTVNIPLGE